MFVGFLTGEEIDLDRREEIWRRLGDLEVTLAAASDSESRGTAASSQAGKASVADPQTPRPQVEPRSDAAPATPAAVIEELLDAHHPHTHTYCQGDCLVVAYREHFRTALLKAVENAVAAPLAVVQAEREELTAEIEAFHRNDHDREGAAEVWRDCYCDVRDALTALRRSIDEVCHLVQPGADNAAITDAMRQEGLRQQCVVRVDEAEAEHAALAARVQALARYGFVTETQPMPAPDWREQWVKWSDLRAALAAAASASETK